MQKINFFFIAVIITLISMISCARRGSITGGLKDTISPILLSSFPKNFSTNFSGKELKLNFDEYVKLKNINKQLIVSPPLKYTPEILPYSASKNIVIKLKDTLLPNTTYSFNFGKSIEDNNEGNPYQQFKFVFSTGNHIDSLSLSAKIKDALEIKTQNFVSIMLYEVNDKYSDSIIYKQVPRYIANTLDSLKLVKLENLKSGKYLLVALKDENGNNKFDPKIDKIGFQKDFITIPNDTLYELELFKEELPFKAVNVSQFSGTKMTLGYQGNPKDTKIIVKKGDKVLPIKITQLPKKDSLQIWHNATKGDSLTIEISKGKYNKTFSLTQKTQKKDTLSFNALQNGNLSFREYFTLNASIPLSKFDKTKMKLINKDSSEVKFTTEYDEFNQNLKFIFKSEPTEKYSLKLFPGAITDFYDKVNDTLKYDFSTKNFSDYGNLKIVLEKVKHFPVIVELTDKDGKVIVSEYSEKNNIVLFDLIEPNKYTVRLIYDGNGNKKWDAGNFLDKRQSEEVIYFPKEIDVRANWDVEQAFDVGK